MWSIFAKWYGNVDGHDVGAYINYTTIMIACDHDNPEVASSLTVIGRPMACEMAESVL